MMKSFRMHGIAMLLGLCALSGAADAASVEDIVRDTQRVTVENGKLSMVWWIPLEFWAETVRENPGLSEDVRAEIIRMMADYTVLALVRADVNPDGMENVQSKEALKNSTHFDYGGKVLQPLPDEQISPAAAGVIVQLKPILTEAVGPVGEALDFLVYPAVLDDKVVVDAGLPGLVTVTFFGERFMWRLPLASLLPQKKDKATGEKFPGNFEYNPFTGKKLDVSAAPAAPAKPATPAAPARPATPPTPAKPATPATPAKPATPATPAK